jgi:Domain of unknown function (DUF4173)
MSTDLSASLTPENSAIQSFQVPETNCVRNEWRWVTEKTIWSYESRIKAMLLATFITIMAHWVWRENGGYLGYAAFILISAIALYVGIRFSKLQPAVSKLDGDTCSPWWQVGAIAGVAIACLRMAWQGNVPVSIFSIILLGMMSISLHKKSLTMGSVISRFLFSIVDGLITWIKLHDCIPLVAYALRRWPWMVWGVPVMVSSLFLVPLTLAHPDLVASLAEWTGNLLERFFAWMEEWDLFEAFVLVCVAAFSMGMLLPSLEVSIVTKCLNSQESKSCSELAYSIIRNTLISVNAVFFVFLIFEFNTLWFRTFPKSFHYPGYAHQGATWLTISLAMSTIALSIMFSSSTHLHPNVKRLKRLATFWCIGNLLLVIAVYHRLTMYVDYNGLTRMRIVGYVGVTCVLAGFILVYCRVMRSRGLAWLIHRQIWALAISLFALSVLPMDWIAHRWNTSIITQGRMSPTVHLAAQPLSDEGLLCLFELVESKEPLVRNGVLALLAKREINELPLTSSRMRNSLASDSSLNSEWGEFQGATYLLRQKYDSISDELEPFRKSLAYQERVWREFHQWAMQWH